MTDLKRGVVQCRVFRHHTTLQAPAATDSRRIGSALVPVDGATGAWLCTHAVVGLCTHAVVGLRTHAIVGLPKVGDLAEKTRNPRLN
jgi:hypothetical protein